VRWSVTSYKVLGIGAPVMDHVIRVSDQFIDSIDGGKGGMLQVSFDTLSHLLNTCGSDATLIAGGSCANTIKGLAQLGTACGFTGRLGRDVKGQAFYTALTNEGVTMLPYSVHTPTAQALCLVTPDGERTMRTYFGASEEMQADDLSPSYFEGIELLHLEGYNLLKGSLVERALELAQSAGAKVSLDLASYEIVKAQSKRITKLIAKHVDILIANADEAFALTGLPPEKACSVLKDVCELAVVLFGAGGCWVGNKSDLLHGPSFPAHPIDTTGAGDLFTSGFLHGYLEKMPLATCAKWGNLAGSAVVEVLGAEVPPAQWDKIKKEIEKDRAMASSR